MHFSVVFGIFLLLIFFSLLFFLDSNRNCPKSICLKSVDAPTHM